MSGSQASSTNHSATVSWTAPTTYTNGSPLSLSDLQGFHVHYGTSSSALSQEITVPNASAVTYTVGGLTAGTWYFAVSAYTSSGESGLSATESKTIS
ncbi:MAG: fibronectin type III domain-containing protein [Proteobacteria bacterium]|nr:fibronectin type III domain-containing protein [Pseudomonadota bacterium]